MSGLALTVFAALLLAAAASDVARWRIPNGLCVALALAALTLAFPQSAHDALSRGGSFLAVSAVALVLYLRGGLGGGDVKLMAAAALWMPLSTLPVFALALGLAGGVQALATLALRRLAPAGPDAAPARRRMPYGLSIATAGLAWAALAGGLT